MRCEVVAIGTELLLGQIVDTNSAWIGAELAHELLAGGGAAILEALKEAP